jgi:hypothetical protein
MVKNARFTKFFSWPLIILAVVILGLIVIAVLEFTNTINFLHGSKKPLNVSTGSSETKGEPEQSTSSQSPASNQNTESEDNKTPVNTNSSANSTLLEPTGNFVSNHHPNLSGSPAPSQMSSTCNTTPGATCQISFIKDGVVKTLPRQVTDRGGATYWSWKLQDLSLTEGAWQIKATATLNGQMKMANDAINLEVGP